MSTRNLILFGEEVTGWMAKRQPDFGTRLRTARRRAGFTQEQVARALNVSVTTYCRWEYGTAVPNAVAATRLAGLLGCTVEQIFA